MEVVNAAGLKPFSCRRWGEEPRRIFPLKFLKRPNFSKFSTGGLLGGFAALSSVFSSNGEVRALTYEEALQQTLGSSFSTDGSLSFDIGQFVVKIVNFASENLLLIGGGALVLGVPLAVSQILKEDKNYGIESAKNAYSNLSTDGGAQLLDIREGREFKEVGSPDIRNLKKKAVSITYKGDSKPAFLKKLSAKFKDSSSTTLYILDKFDGNSELVAELVASNGFKAAFAIEDGADGPRGWKNSGLPWSEPRKTLNIDLSDLQDAIYKTFWGDSNGLPVSLGLAAATGLSLVAFTEVETLLQLLGSAALLQFVTKKLLFAQDRRVTLQQVDEFLTTKVAPKELLDEIKLIGKALLPAQPTARARLPAPAEEKQSNNNVPETVLELKVDASSETEPALKVNSVQKGPLEEESLPLRPRPLSPYPYYPDFKPPASPSPTPP